MSKQIECERCSHRMNYDDSIPKFCSECGGSLSGSYAQYQAEETIARSSETPLSRDDVTLPPDQTGPVTKAHVEKFQLESVGPYRLVKKLGQGGMGTVFEAQHVESGRSVALKLLSPEVRGTDEMVQRFRRESQIAASINHPRSTFVYESGEHDGQLYITMELMDGGTLKDVVAKEGPLPVGRAVDYVLDIIDGLLVAHNAGIVHRDLKPSNSFVDREGRIKVGDFGLAKSFLGDSSLTQTGTFMGTPQYAAPEQIRNSNVDERTDIYALGGTLFYLLTGRAPFTGNPAQVISSIASDIPPKLNEVVKGIPKPLIKLVAQTLEKDPEKRPFNLNVVRDALLPFSTRGSMAADPGRRMGAYFVDSIIMAIVGSSLIGAISPLLLFIFGGLHININPQYFGVVIYFCAIIAYFTISESKWGRTLGKWLFGLRVVSKNSESPSFLSALIRASLVPGLIILIDQSISLFFLAGSDMNDMGDVMTNTFKAQATATLIKWAALLGMISTARKENSYMTIHDWLSGTRIVRLSGNLESRMMDESPVIVPQTSSQEQTKIGEYEVIGTFQNQPDQKVATHFALDNQLERPVWLFTGFDASPFEPERRHLTRPSRLRVIRQSSDENGHWYSTESVPGIPLAQVIKASSCPWKSVCPLFRDIAYELALADENDLIPDNLTIEHFWLDHTGRIRVLDHLLVGKNESGSNDEDTNKEQKRRHAVDTIADLFRYYMDHQDHPVELMEIKEKFVQYKNNDPFDWLVTELNETIEKQLSWNWIDRAGMMAISAGIEFSLMSSMLFAAGYIFSGFPTFIHAALTFLVGWAIVACYAYFVEGGPAMRLTGVCLRRNHDKQPVSRGLKIARSIIAWTPGIFLISALFVYVFTMMNLDKELPTSLNSPALVVTLIIAATAALFLWLGGILFALLNPRRGLPDFLLGTRLMRK